MKIRLSGWEKFCNYFDVEPRYVPISEDHKVLDGHDLDKYVDENTIGVVAIMGVTYTGMYEPVEQISEALDRIEERTGLDVRIHVDGASGGMIAPFIQPDLAWDFRVNPFMRSRSCRSYRFHLRSGLSLSIHANTGMSEPSFHSVKSSICSISPDRYFATSCEVCCTLRYPSNPKRRNM